MDKLGKTLVEGLKAPEWAKQTAYGLPKNDGQRFGSGHLTPGEGGFQDQEMCQAGDRFPWATWQRRRSVCEPLPASSPPRISNGRKCRPRSLPQPNVQPPPV